MTAVEDEQAPVNDVYVSRVTGNDGFALREGNVTQVVVSDRLPPDAQRNVAGMLLRAVNSRSAPAATASVPKGAGLGLPAQRGIDSVRR